MSTAPLLLAPAVLEQVARLGGRVVPLSPAPELVQTPRGARALPGPIDQWVRGVQWPRRLRFEGEFDDRTWRRVDLGVGGPLDDYACAAERDYWAIAHLAGGNDYVLVDLDAPDLADPEVCRLPHDEFDRDPRSFGDLDRLSELLQRLRPMRR